MKKFVKKCSFQKLVGGLEIIRTSNYSYKLNLINKRSKILKYDGIKIKNYIQERFVKKSRKKIKATAQK